MADNQKKRWSYAAGSWALLVAVALAIFVINFLGHLWFQRLDMTQGKDFTLSQSTKDTLSKLNDVVTIKGYFSSNVSVPMLRQQMDQAMDLLREYQAYSKGNIKVEIINPAASEEAQKEAEARGIQAFNLPMQDINGVKVEKVWVSIYIEYLKKSEILPTVTSTETLEYDLTSTINRLTSGEPTKIGFLNDDPNRKIFEEFGRLKSVLDKQFKVEEVSTTGGKAIDKSFKVLILANPYRLTDRDLYEIDQYLMGGGNAIFLADGTRVILRPNEFGVPMPFYAMAMNEQMDTLGKFLMNFGVKRGYDLVQDKSYTGFPLLGSLTTPYPLFPKVDYGQSKQTESPITQSLQSVTFTWVSSLELGQVPASAKATKLAVTTPESWLQGGQQLFVDPTKEPMPPLPVPGMGPAERTLAVLLTGKFNSYFAGKPVPAPEAGDSASPPPQAPPPGERKDVSSDINILITGTSTFVSDAPPIGITDNINFIVSAIEFMAGGQQFSDIRKRKVEPRQVDLETPSQAILALLVAPFAAPLGIVVFGVVRYTYRRKQKNKFLESVK